MINQFEDFKTSRWPEHILSEYRAILDQGILELSSLENVRQLKDLSLTEHEEERLQSVGRIILWSDENRGFGYLSSSVNHDRKKERMTARYIADCFQAKESPVQPIIVLVDDFYHFCPGNPSLVSKTQIFDEIAVEQLPSQDFAIVLSGFTESRIFTQSALKQVPYQDNAGLELGKITQFGNELLYFASNGLRSLIEKNNGNLDAVLKQMSEAGNFPEDDVRLLLVTSLLLQDMQKWQNLWYESRKKGTPLYIVAPMSFHDAMNRLNFEWGHGGLDYRYRASNSLGNHDEPPLENNVTTENYYNQGLSSNDFQRKVSPILEKFKK
ncbi:MAG: hypothetical protein H6773_00305 [Pseudomonadales bacterium]|nr:hypothetical protein [Pseudomonadales bacterium]